MLHMGSHDHNRTWKAIDMDSAVEVDEPLCGKLTVKYMPPEVARLVCEGRQAEYRAKPAYDSWSLGIMLLEMLCPDWVNSRLALDVMDPANNAE